MKTVAAILVAMVVSATATYFVTGTSSKVETQQKVEAETEDKDKAIAALRKALGEATAKANKSEVILVEGAKVSLQGVVTDPADLIDKLANDALTGEDTDSQRRVIHYFESLVDAGNDAVPAIDAFLDQHQDKEFGRQSIRQRLQITSSQIEEMKALEEKTRDQVREKMGAIWRDENMSREEKGEKMRAFFEEMRDQYTALMTEEQKAQLQAMGDDGGRAIRSLIGGGGGRPGGGRGGPGGRR
ncbi:MAG: hypothetical protein VYD34_05220 [Verrucomicrobiota bacterium]|jgi:hypothetical protein|nr:hypothetical protein [Verrucomicrobiota bacterium]MEE2715389.1 hypothetical protein [Verrucomicrobiota bacterium]